MGDDLSFYTPEQLFQLQESGRIKIQTESSKKDEKDDDIQDWSDRSEQICQEKKTAKSHSKVEHTKKFYETFHKDDLYYYDSKFGDCFEIDQDELNDYDDAKDSDYKDVTGHSKHSKKKKKKLQK